MFYKLSRRTIVILLIALAGVMALASCGADARDDA